MMIPIHLSSILISPFKPINQLVMKVIEGEKLSLSGVQRTDMGKRNRNYHKLKYIQQEFLLSSHLGGYLCIASNGIPPSVSKRYDVQVNCKWPISWKSSTKKYQNNDH